MKRMRFSLVLIACVSIIGSTYAQPAIPVDLVTGRAQISVPLTLISDGGLSAPVSLTYNATGVKVADGSANAGMGWSLSAGGGVYRQVRGLPDDYAGNPNDANDLRRGWLYGSGTSRIGYQIHNFTQSSDASLGTYTDEAADYTYFNNLAYTKDTEPDLYTFSAPGLSGGFVFGPDGLPKPVPYQDIKITFSAGLPIGVFYITKNDGTKYTFGASTKVIQFTRVDQANTPMTQFMVQGNLYLKVTNFTTVWELNKIETLAGEKIDLTFTAERFRNSIDYVAISSITTPAPDTSWYYDKQISLRLLQKVESRTRKVEFQWGGGDDLIYVTVTDKITGKDKDFSLYWNDVIGSDSQTSPTSRRFLASIYETSGCDRFPSYTFEYYGVTNNTIPIPFNNPRTKSDIWGYFNNTATNDNPTVYFYSNNAGSDRYRFYEIPGQSYTSRINGGTDRSVNPNTVMYGSLKVINYPTGGQTEIVYEPNSYHDLAANGANYGPGIRVKQVITKDQVAGAPNTVIDYEYKMSDNTSSGKWIYRSAFAYHDVSKLYATNARDNSPEPQIMYERVTVSQNGKGKVVTEFKLPGMDPVTSYGSGDYADWSAARTYIARSGNIPAGELTMYYYQMPFAPNVNYDFERGLVSKVSSYNSSNYLIHEKVYQYQRLATSSVVVKGLRYELLKKSAVDTLGTSPMYVFSHYPVLANTSRVLLVETERVADMNDVNKWLETSTTYTFSSVHHMLSMMSVTNSDGITHRTKFRYARDYASLTQPSSNVNAQMIKKLNDDFMHGAPVATISSIYNGSETITGASVTLYGSFPDSLGVSRALPAETIVTNGMSGWSEPVVSPSSGSNQVLVTSGTYATAGKIEQYDFLTTPLTVRTKGKTLNAVHMGYGRSLPVAIISNAAANEVVHDGFETYTGFDFDGTHPHPPLPQFTFPSGWSGKKGLGMPASGSIHRTGVLKGKGTYYRYTIRVSGSNNTNISFRVFNGSTEVVSAVINHNTGNNNWKFYEGRINMSSAPAPPTPFTLKLENNTAVTIDDVSFYPESAALSSFTYEPMVGKTSETDTRGVNVFYEYDELGRVRDLKDQDKTLRQHTDYYYKTLPFPQLQTDFTPTTNPLVAVGQQVTYTAPSNECITGVTYDWYVDGVKLANDATTFQYTFTQLKIYFVKMVAEHITYGTASRQVEVNAISVGTGPIAAGVSTGSLIYTNCDANHNKTFTATLTGCYLPNDVSITWYYKLGGSVWTQLFAPQTKIGINVLATISGDFKTMEFNPVVAFNGVGNLNDYQVKFEVRARCPLDTGDNYGVEYVDVEEKSIDFQFNPNCQ